MNKKLSITLLALAAFVASACEERLLNPEPSTSLSIEAAFTDTEVIDTFVTGVYNELSLNPYQVRQIPSMDVRGGDVFITPTNNYNRYPIEYQFTEAPNSSYVSGNVWFRAYKMIGLTNVAITNLATSPVPDAYKTAVEAEMRIFRAVGHLDLVRMFARPYAAGRDNLGVVLATSVKNPDDEPLGRATVGEVYDAILADLLYAEANLPASRNDKSRFTVSTVKGLLARVYLDMEDWANASIKAKEVIDSGNFSLMSDVEWLSGFESPNNEWMWYIGYTSDDNVGFLSVHSFWDAARRLGYNSMRLSPTFINNNFSATDIRGLTSVFHSSTTGNPVISGGGYVSLKLMHNAGFLQQQVMMRLSEMYLIYAEAEARLGGAQNVTNAQDALFEIQSRADVNAVKSTSTGATLVEEILLERRKEFYAEGFAYNDLQRLQRDLVRSTADGHWPSVEGTIADDDYRRISPIPQFEIDGNPAIATQQNPGYGN